MFSCEVCGKKYKTMQALGGHMRSHEPKKPEIIPADSSLEPLPLSAADEAEQTVEQPQNAPTQMTTPDSEPGVMESIRGLKRRGLSARQIKELGYKRQTVDDVFLEEIVPEGKPEEEYGENDEFPIVTRGTEIVTPEGILRKLTNGNPDWNLRFEGMMLLRAAQRMNRDDIEMSKMQADSYAAMIKPTLEMMEKNREAQDAAAARARESNVEIARRAAYEAVQDTRGSLSADIQELKAALPKKEEETNPMARMFFTAMQPYMGQVLAQVFSGMSGKRLLTPSQGTQQPGQVEGQADQPAVPDSAPVCMKTGEEDEFQEL